MSIKENKKYDKCEICGKNLKYVTQTDMTEKLSCYFCGQEDIVNIYCPDGHYICSKCHSRGPVQVIEEFCEKTELKDPLEIADTIMQHPKFKVYGPEHHVLTAAAILTALKNNNAKKPNGAPITIDDVYEGIKRTSKIPGGWCGFYGSCGAGMASGVAISVFTGATPARDKERTLANKMTSIALSKIADDLEHCCKRSLKLSICETMEFLNEKFDITVDYNLKRCPFSKNNDRCEKQKCPIY